MHNRIHDSVIDLVRGVGDGAPTGALNFSGQKSVWGGSTVRTTTAALVKTNSYTTQKN